MSARIAALAVALCIAIAGAGCSGGDDEAGSPTTAEATTTTTEIPTTTATEATTTTTAAATTTTTESEGPATSPDVLAADGIQSAEDAAVFVVTSWIGGDRAAASRHAEAGALDPAGVQALIETGPSEEVLDDYIAGYTTLAQQPVVLH